MRGQTTGFSTKATGYQTVKHDGPVTAMATVSEQFWIWEILEPELERAQVELQHVETGYCRAVLARAVPLELTRNRHEQIQSETPYSA